jgi:transposase-like protein
MSLKMIFGFSEGGIMARKNYTTEKIIHLLREAEVEIAKGVSTKEVARKLGISEQTYYRWRKTYGGLKIDQAKRLKALERENARLKQLVADLTLDNDILKETVRGNY